MFDTTDNPQGTGIEEAAKKFEAILGGEQPNPAEDEEERLDAANSEDETPETDEDSEELDEEVEDAEDDAEADAEEDQEADLPEDALVTVKIDGKEEKIPLKEALAGYQRQADYSRKTQELAEQRRAFYAEASQIQQERAQYSVLLNSLQNQLRQEMQQEPDWNRLKAEDPLEYTIQREEWRERQEKLQAIQAEYGRLSQVQQREQVMALAQTVKQEQAQLYDKMPDWKDQKKWDATRKQLREYGEELGFSQEELSQAYDHRAVLALYKAMQYDRMVGRKGKPVPVERRGPRPMTPGPAPTKSRRVTEMSRAKQRLAKTGSVRDAAAVFEKLL